MNKIKNSDKGFTIIEVVLVLAIAGLIFLIVFIALPQLQKSRRDTQRKSDLDRIVATMDDYAANNNGIYPKSGSGTHIQSWVNNYFDSDEFTDPSTNQKYSTTGNWGVTGWTVQVDEIPTKNPGYIALTINATCDGDTTTNYSPTPLPGTKNMTMVMKLEQGQVCRESSE